MREEITGEPPADQQVNVVMSEGVKDIAGLPEHMREVASKMTEWVTDQRQKASSMIDRESYKGADDVFEQMRYARAVAAEDDIVSNAIEMTEGLTFQGVKWEGGDPDIQDLFNQMAAEQNLDELVRKIWREEFTCSQVVIGSWWQEGTFKVRGMTESGNKRKSTKKVWYPRKLTILDSARVLPVGSLNFGQERLAWVATDKEMELLKKVTTGAGRDDIVDRFWAGVYQADPEETTGLKGAKSGRSNLKNLILLKEDAVSRHTLTRPDYERWAPVRLASIFPLVDLKAQLMAADRVALIGAANYILLVKKGDKENPAHQEEVDNLKAGFKVIAKVPVIFSDHRLSIEIITPAQDYTLDHGKYDMIDVRILQRLMNGIPGASMKDGQDGAISLGRTVSRSLEGRRHMIKRYLERILAKQVMEHPRNAGVFGSEDPPNLTYFPAAVMLQSDAQLAQQIISLRTQKELSRETTLEYFGYDQAVEAIRRKFEEDNYDDVFQTVVPFSSPGQGGGGTPADGKPPAAQGPAGAAGGRPIGGGKPSQNPAKTNVTDNGTTSTKRT